jgi:uncharacterized protein (TIGR00645 family)
MADPTGSHRPRPVLETWIALWLFRSRWLLAPFYVGLSVALAGLLVVFAREAAHELAGLFSMSPEQAILMALSLIDLSLAGNLLLIVVLSGYENFVAKIRTGAPEDRPDWMGTVDFSGLKMKLVASIIAISAIALLREFMRIDEGDHIPDRDLAWMVGLHVTFLASGVMLAWMDYLAGKTDKH